MFTGRAVTIGSSLGLLLLGITAGYVILEGGLRLWFYRSLAWPNAHLPSVMFVPHPTVGWVLKPNQEAAKDRLQYQGIVRTNSKGLRDREHEYEPAAGVFRILILGDSFMQGASVDERDSFPHLLEERLRDRNIEVINLGVEGFSTVQEYLYLKDEGLRYRPNLVLLGLYAENDVCDNDWAIAKRLSGTEHMLRPYAQWDASAKCMTLTAPDTDLAQTLLEARLKADTAFKRWMKHIKRSLTSRIYKQILGSFRQKVSTGGADTNLFLGVHLTSYDPLLGKGTPLSAGEYQHLWDEAWRITEQALVNIQRLAEMNAARFAMFTVPSKAQADARYLEAIRARFPGIALDPDQAERRVQAIANAKDIPFRGLLQPFRIAQAADKTPLFYTIDDTHWTPAGHRLAVEETVRWLDAQRLIPPAQQGNAATPPIPESMAFPTPAARS